MEHNLTITPIKDLIKKISIPVSIGFFFNTMFNVTDTYFGGKIGTEALAALSLSFPVFFLIIIFASGTSTGTTALIANTIGEGEHDKVKKYTGQVISFGLILSVFITILGLLLAPSIFKLLGAEGNYLSIALQYMNVVFYGSVFFMMISVLNSILQAAGNTKIYRNFLIGGFFLNAILDPLFLYGWLGIPPLGIRGLALATIFVEFLGCIYIFSEVVKKGYITKETWKHLKPDVKAYKEIFKQAMPASLNMATIGVGIFVITYFISKFGEDAVAAYGIATRVEQIILLPTIGLTIAALSIIGQNNGAKKYDRIKECWILCLKYGTSMMAIGAILVLIFRKNLMSFFTDNTNVIEIGSNYLIYASIIFVAYAMLFITISTLQGMKHTIYPVFIGLYRQIIGPTIIFYILTKIFNFGILGIWWGILLITWSASFITVLYGRHILKVNLSK